MLVYQGVDHFANYSWEHHCSVVSHEMWPRPRMQKSLSWHLGDMRPYDMICCIYY